MASIFQFMGSSIIHIKKEKIGKRWIKFMKETYQNFQVNDNASAFIEK